ncbi:MAG: hypothetical protein HOV70_01785 [Streptomyces sp.]|nr:hypothetical protein [Streptomyces sp.]
MADTKACRVYVPPTGAEDSGYCARCGMFDWRHTGTLPSRLAWRLARRYARRRTG